MPRETDCELYARREQEELVLAISATDALLRDSHFALANAYREKVKRLGGTSPEIRAPLTTTPLDMEVENGEVVLDGQLPVAATLTPDAALDTGTEQIRSRLKAD